MRLSSSQKSAHNNALYLAKRHLSLEARLVAALRDVEKLGVHKQFGMSLFKYAVDEEYVEIRVTLTRSAYEKLQRAQSLEAQKQRDSGLGNVLESVAEAYLDKNDPVRKAERVSKKKLRHVRVESPSRKNGLAEEDSSETLSKPSEKPARIPLTAEQKHAVFLRDKGRCTHKNIKGQVCGSDRWTEIHHIVSISRGGTNDLENLTTLCSFHHDLVHQLSLPIDGQINWLRSPAAKYA